MFLPGSHVLCVPGREGHHQNVENLNEAQTKHDKLAACLGITAEKKYVYDEAAGVFRVQLRLRPDLRKDGFLQKRTHQNHTPLTRMFETVASLC